MRSRFPSASGISYQFGPAPLTPAIKALVIANVVAFVIDALAPSAGLSLWLGLSPQAVLKHGYVWQPLTYMFLHGGISHILFNMLSLWMFGTDLERLWGSKFFARYYFVTGIGAGIVTVLVALLPFSATQLMYIGSTVGASGAIFGLLLAYGVTFPDRPIYLYFLFQIPAKYFVMIVGAVALYSSLTAEGGGVAHFAHLGGIVIGYAYLKMGRRVRFHPIAEMKYRYTKWKISRLRRKFDVHQGGRSDDWKGRIH